MKTYDPQIKVTLIKAAPRTGTSFTDTDPNGKSISTRFEPTKKLSNRYSDIAHRRIDLTSYLGDGGGLHTSKSVREAAGSFTITMLDISYTAIPRLPYQIPDRMHRVLYPTESTRPWLPAALCFSSGLTT